MYFSLVSRVAALLFLSTLFLAVSSKPIKTLKQFDMRGALESYLKTANFGYGRPSSGPSKTHGPSSTWSRGISSSTYGHGVTTDQFTKPGFGTITYDSFASVGPTYGSESQPGQGSSDGNAHGSWGD